jgi:hypothetical protein
MLGKNDDSDDEEENNDAVVLDDVVVVVDWIEGSTEWLASEKKGTEAGAEAAAAIDVTVKTASMLTSKNLDSIFMISIHFLCIFM